MVTSPNHCRRQAGLAYRIRPNGSAGSWYWEVTRRGTIVARGLGPTRVRAPADAIIATASYAQGLSEVMTLPPGEARLWGYFVACQPQRPIGRSFHAWPNALRGIRPLLAVLSQLLFLFLESRFGAVTPPFNVGIGVSQVGLPTGNQRQPDS
jgi:hypothetical protein